MTEEDFLDQNGCKTCGSKDLKITVGYSNPLVYMYECKQCKHWGRVQQSNYRLPVIKDYKDYLLAKEMCKPGEDIMNLLEAMGAEIDYGPEPEYEYT